MHVAPERAVRDAEASSTVTPPSLPFQRLPHSISESLYVADSQMAMISERRSLQCLRPIISMQRPVSPASTVSSRRSVSGMKQLLPLKLQPSPPLPKVDLSSWLENAIPNMQPPVSLDSGIETTFDTHGPSGIPWMSYPKAVRPPHDLRQSHYSKRAIDSVPGSPMSSLPYFGDKESCNKYHPVGSICDEFCISGDNEDAETNSNSRGSFVESKEIFNVGKIGSIHTSPTSFASSRLLKLSIECQGDSIPPMDSTWMTSNSSQQSEAEFYETASNHREDRSEYGNDLPEAWLDNASSQSSSSSTYDEVLNAFATKLAPAKAHVVELSKQSQNIPGLTRRSKTYRQNRPATPYRTSRIRRNETYENNAIEDKTPREHLKYDDLHHLSAIPNVHPVAFEYGSPRGPTRNQSRDETDENIDIPQQYAGSNPERINISNVIIDSIFDVVLDFPQRMLFLDSPCVTDMRYQNHSASSYTDTSRLPSPTCSFSDDGVPSNQSLRASICRRTAATSFFASFVRSTSTKTSPSLHEGALYTTRPSQRRPITPPSISPPLNLPFPGLSVFQDIFPNSQDWWRGVLYAHLVSYNYVREITASQTPTFGIPPKASRTLGLSQALSKPTTALHPDPPTFRASLKVSRTLDVPELSSNKDAIAISQNERLMRLENELVRCITWIANCMSGIVNSSTGKQGTHATHSRDLILVRSLAEIVKACERGVGEAA